MSEVRLTEAQQAAVNEIDHHLQLIACAGSGKTEVLTRRIVHIIQERPHIRPEQIVAFTFTEKAAASLKKRVNRALSEAGYGESATDNVFIGTIHGFCSRLLRTKCDGFQEFTVLDTVKNHLFVQRYANNCGMSDLELENNQHNIPLFLECIAKMVDDYDNRKAWEDIHKVVFEKYRSCLYEHKYTDFALMILETLQQMEENQALREHLSSIRYLIVDEYQDVDDLQEKLIRTITMMGANLCVVGDDDQTIYQFRGSNADNIIGFAQRYPNVVQIRMEDNFRCAEQIVSVADLVIRHNAHRLEKQMRAGTDSQGEISGKRFGTEEEQYAFITEQIQCRHAEGIPYSEIAILTRKGKYINPICSVLDAATIPFATESADHFFQGEYFGRFVQTLSILANVDKAALFECWKDYVDADAFSKAFRTLRRTARGGGNAQQIPLSGTIRQFVQDTGFLDESAVDYAIRLDDFEGFALILDDFDEIFGDWQLSARVDGIMRFLEEQAVDEYKYHSFKQNSLPEDAVQVMTVHKSKGLEFDTVFLPNLEQGEFPAAGRGGKKYWHVLGGCFAENSDRYASDVEDERKLFYVAVTRAKSYLFLNWRFTNKDASIFVQEAADADFLKLDRSQLLVPKVAKASGRNCNFEEDKKAKDAKAAEKAEREEQYRAEREFRDYARYARHALMDYYGTAAHSGMKAAYADLSRVKNLDDYSVIAEAQRMGLI